MTLRRVELAPGDADPRSRWVEIHQGGDGKFRYRRVTAGNRVEAESGPHDGYDEAADAAGADADNRGLPVYKGPDPGQWETKNGKSVPRRKEKK